MGREGASASWVASSSVALTLALALAFSAADPLTSVFRAQEILGALDAMADWDVHEPVCLSVGDEGESVDPADFAVLLSAATRLSRAELVLSDKGLLELSEAPPPDWARWARVTSRITEQMFHAGSGSSMATLDSLLQTLWHRLERTGPLRAPATASASTPAHLARHDQRLLALAPRSYPYLIPGSPLCLCDLPVFVLWPTESDDGDWEQEGPLRTAVFESIFLRHPAARVFVLSPDHPPMAAASALRRYAAAGFHVRWLQVNWKTFFERTPLAGWARQVASKIADSPRRAGMLREHLRDAMRLAVAWRFGGVVMDADVVLLRSVCALRNAAGRYRHAQRHYARGGNYINVGNQILGVFEPRLPSVWVAMERLVSLYDTWTREVAGAGLLSYLLSRETGALWLPESFDAPCAAPALQALVRREAELAFDFRAQNDAWMRNVVDETTRRELRALYTTLVADEVALPVTVDAAGGGNDGDDDDGDDDDDKDAAGDDDDKDDDDDGRDDDDDDDDGSRGEELGGTQDVWGGEARSSSTRPVRACGDVAPTSEDAALLLELRTSPLSTSAVSARADHEPASSILPIVVLDSQTLVPFNANALRDSPALWADPETALQLLGREGAPRARALALGCSDRAILARWSPETLGLSPPSGQETASGGGGGGWRSRSDARTSSSSSSSSTSSSSSSSSASVPWAELFICSRRAHAFPLHLQGHLPQYAGAKPDSFVRSLLRAHQIPDDVWLRLGA